MERAKRAIRVYFLIRNLVLTLNGEVETQLPLTNLQNCVQIEQALDLSISRCVSMPLVIKQSLVSLECHLFTFLWHFYWLLFYRTKKFNAIVISCMTCWVITHNWIWRCFFNRRVLSGHLHNIIKDIIWLGFFDIWHIFFFCKIKVTRRSENSGSIFRLDQNFLHCKKSVCKYKIFWNKSVLIWFRLVEMYLKGFYLVRFC